MIFEVTSSSFDGSTNATNGSVFWVRADSHRTILDCIDGTGAQCCGQIDGEMFSSRLDYILPDQQAALRSMLAT